MCNNFEISFLVVMPKITTNHAITYTNHYNVKLQKSVLKILIVVR